MTQTAEAPASPRLSPEVLRTTIAVISGGIAVIFDSTIVSVALKQLGIHLHTTVGTIQWVSTGYLLAMFVAIPATGWLQARLGGKRLWLWSLGLFLLGSVLCAFSWNAPSLLAFRVVQGLGGGVMLPLMTTLVMQAARGQSLGRVMAVIALPISLGPILGPVIGGVILNYLDWRWLFLVNVPICVIGAALGWRMLADDRPAPGTRPSFDAVGFALLTPGVVGLVYGLTNVSKPGAFGRADVLVPVLLGLGLVGGFLAWALPRRGRALIDVRLMRHRPLAIGTFLLFLTGVTIYGTMLLLPLFWQEVRSYGPLGAGLLLIPQGIGNLASRPVGGRATDEIGPRTVAVAGFAIITVATLPFAFATGGSAIWWLMAVLLVRGFGLGLVMTPLMSVAYVGLERAEMPDASIITRVSQQLGGSFGTAVLAMILESATSNAHTLDDLAHGFDHAFWWAVGFGALAVALSFLIPRTTRE